MSLPQNSKQQGTFLSASSRCLACAVSHCFIKCLFDEAEHAGKDTAVVVMVSLLHEFYFSISLAAVVLASLSSLPSPSPTSQSLSLDLYFGAVPVPK